MTTQNGTLPAKQLGKIKAVLFDMDGLLIDSEGIYTQVVNEVLKPYGKEQTWEIKANLMGKPEREAVKTLLSALWPDEKDWPFTIDSFLEQRNMNLDGEFAKVKPMPGAIRLVKHLADSGVPICVATGSKTRNFKIKSGNNIELFAPFGSRIVCGDDPRLQRGKPNPDIFLLAAREGLGMHEGVREIGPDADGTSAGAEDSFLVFEDAKPGVEAARAAGMKVVWVPDANLRALFPNEELGADQTINSLLDFKPEEWGLPAFPKDA